MNETFSTKSDIFQNPENKPLEDLKLVVQNNGIKQTIPALDKHWVETKYFLYYEPPYLIDSDGRDIIGAKERWLEVTSYILDDLNWLLHLPFHRFWSNIIHNPAVMNSVISFLQEAPTFFTLDNFPNDRDIKEQFNKLRKNILILFARLVTNQESPSEYVSLKEYAHLLYNKYIFTVPILMDLCQQYGRDNRKTVERIVNSVFTIQPLFQEDLEKAVTFIIQALRNIERRFEDCPIDEEGKAVPLSERGGANTEINLSSLEDMILYLLDTLSTINITQAIYPASVNKFKMEPFLTRITSIYGNTIPEMYKRLDDLGFKDESIAKFMELKHRLDVTRIEILHTYRTIIFKNVKEIHHNKDSYSNSEIGEIVEDFLTNITYYLSEREFVIDYYNLYPFTEDFQLISELYPDLDTVKCEFIIDSIFTFLDEPKPSSMKKVPVNNCINEPTAGPSRINEHSNISDQRDETCTAGSSNTNLNSKVDLAILISEVKDIFSDLGEGFIERCLKHYNNNKETVINALLEDSLPSELKCLDRALPFIPPDPEETLAAIDSIVGVQRLNIYDNDEFDIMTKDVIDTSRIHKGKRKDKYKDFNQLLNDKSYIAETKDIYNKYSIVTSEYNDEYDDTYDDQNIVSSAQDDAIEMDARPFTIPRVLQKQQISEVEEVEEANGFDISPEGKMNRDQFVQDPALLRAKAEERRQSRQGARVFNSRNVVGNLKGQGQTKDVLDSRNQKNKNKSTRANHNRRAGSQWKRNHSMLPS